MTIDELGPVLLTLLVLVIVIGILGRIMGVEIYRRRREGEYAPGKRLKVVRDVTREECPWLKHDIPSGTVLFEYRGPTYGIKNDDHTAVSLDGGIPFFQLPTNSLVDTA